MHSIYVQLIDIIMILQTLHTEPVTEQNLSNVLSWLERLETTVFVLSSRCDVRVFKKKLNKTKNKRWHRCCYSGSRKNMPQS